MTAQRLRIRPPDGKLRSISAFRALHGLEQTALGERADPKSRAHYTRHEAVITALPARHK